MEIPQLSPILVDKVMSELHANERWKYYENRLNDYKKTGNLGGIKKISAILDKLEKDTLENYIQSLAQEKVSVSELLPMMTEKEQQTLYEKLYCVAFLCDSINSCIRDADAIINRNFPDSEISFYKNLKKLNAEVQEQIGIILNTANDKNTELFIKYSDKSHEYMLKQIRCFLKTQKRAKAKALRYVQRHDKGTQKVPQ